MVNAIFIVIITDSNKEASLHDETANNWKRPSVFLTIFDTASLLWLVEPL